MILTGINFLKDYSHGMKNKMQMLINFIVKPRVLLLDEPLTSLDVVVAEEMKSIFERNEGRFYIDSIYTYYGTCFIVM